VTRWVAFAALTLAVLTVLLLSARASQRVVSDLAEQSDAFGRRFEALDDGADHLAAAEPRPDRGGSAEPPTSTVALLANVSVSHAFFAALLLVGIRLADVPVRTLGVGAESTGPEAVGVGIAVGLAIALVNTLAGSLIGTDPSEHLRELLTPASISGWVLLLGIVLPIIAGFEELLFRGVLIGAFSVGFDLPPSLLAVGSSIAFAAGHGAQGRLGIAVTGLLGFVLAGVFVLTGSLLVVVVAHYVVNAAEFVVVEGIGYEPFGSESADSSASSSP
jgi:membrane protease YdiL (CAAX protease family)